MKKIQILSTTFELPDDSALIVGGYISKLDLYLAKRKIPTEEYQSALKNLEILLHQALQSGIQITAPMAHDLIQNVDQMNGFSTSGKKQSWFGSILRGIGLLITLIFRFILKIFRIVFFGSIALLTLAFASGLLLLVPILFVNPTIDNQIIFGVLPEATKWALLLLETAFIVLALGFLGSLWKASASGRVLRIIGYIMLFVSLNGIIYTVFSVSYNYGNTYTKVSEQEITSSGVIIPKMDGKTRQQLDLSIRRNNHDYHLATSRVHLTDQPGKNFKIYTTTTIFARDETTANTYYAQIQPLKFTLSGAVLSVDPMQNGKAKTPILFQGGIREVRVVVK